MARKKKKKHENIRRQALGVLFLGVAILIFLAILSFDVSDPVNLDVNGNRIKVSNWLGPLGSSVSYFLMQWTLGYPILALPLLMALFAIAAIQRKSFKHLGRPVWLLLLWAFLLSVVLAMPEAVAKMGAVTEYYPSGLIGGWLASQLVIYLGKIGSLFLVSLLLIVLIIVSIRIEIAAILSGMGGWFSAIGQFIVKRWNNLREKIRQKLALRRQRKIDAKKKKFEKYKKKEKPDGAEEDEEIPEINLGEPLIKKPPEPTEPAPEPVRKPKQEVPEEDPETKMIQTTLDDIIAKLDQSQDKPQTQKTEPSGNQTNGVDDSGDDLDFEVKEETKNIELDYDRLVKESIARYTFPSIEFLQEPPDREGSGVTREELRTNAEYLEDKLASFGVKARVIKVTAGPVITLYELEPDTGVKVSSITSLEKDLALAMQGRGIRILAPIPGRGAVGIEIPNQNPQIVYLKSLIKSEKFNKNEYELPIALGKTINGEAFIADLTRMPHLLIGGATNSGKSVGINTIITSLLYAVDPGRVKFLMIDPKKLELPIYRELREHYLLWRPDINEHVITQPKNAISMLNSIMMEMDRRSDQLSELAVRNIIEFNEKIAGFEAQGVSHRFKQLPYIVVIIDELADLMLLAAKDIEAPIARLAQMARAVGIHLILATQRPSVDVITGVIKANFPTRIAYQVATKVDSRTILDFNGADKLLGRGDMLFLPPGSPKPIRLQNPFITTKELEKIVAHIRKQPKLPYYSLPQPTEARHSGGDFEIDEGRDSRYEEARAIVVNNQKGSISLLQRRMKIGFARAARLMDELEDDGIVGPQEGSNPREVLVTLQELKNIE